MNDVYIFQFKSFYHAWVAKNEQRIILQADVNSSLLRRDSGQGGSSSAISTLTITN